MALPARFRTFEELSESERKKLFHRYHFENLKGKDVSPLLREKFHPVLKSSGFIQTSKVLFTRAIEPHYVHCLCLRFSSKFPGRFSVHAGIALEILPLSDWSPFATERISLDSDCLFTMNVSLANGNQVFDNGTTLAEANETIAYLVSSFNEFDRRYFRQFVRFPEPVDTLGVEFVQQIEALVSDNSTSKYGSFGATIQFLTLRLALIHRFLGNTKFSRKLLEYGLANYELLALKIRYEELMREAN